MSAHSWLAVENVFGLYGANLRHRLTRPERRHRVPAPGRPGPAVAGLCSSAALLRCPDRVAQVLAVGILVDVAAYLLSTVPTTYWHA